MAKKKKNDKHLYNLDIYLAKVISCFCINQSGIG